MMLIKKRREMEALKLFTNLGSSILGLIVAWNMLEKYLPDQLRGLFSRYARTLFVFFNPYIRIRFPEFTSGNRFRRNQAYVLVHNYLSLHSSSLSSSAKSLKADALQKDGNTLQFSIDEGEEVVDEFAGVKVWWAFRTVGPKQQSINLYGPDEDEKRSYVLTFHKRDRGFVTGGYMGRVMEAGRAIVLSNRQRKLYSNNPTRNWCGWSSVPFEHPASFDTLAMPLKAKERIKKDLVKFSQGKSYYAKIGKPWKRGYLLYGPPGTGKSTMIAAIANFLNYDIYNLELTTVKDNSELIKLLLETTGKSIIVIEDIDCSLDLTGQRNPKTKKKKTNQDDSDSEDDDDHSSVSKALKRTRESNNNKSPCDSKVTLSGLLNFIDGIWSACGGERIIVFTTNYVDKLDPALVRRGRMDMHIEMSYCCFEAFKVLAKNYLDIDDTHRLFGRVEELLSAVKVTPATVAENLLPKSVEESEERCLRNLVDALEALKEKEDGKLKDARRERLWGWVKNVIS
ncbi:AAA-ATPase ASD, mitochondrial [Linum grandiflorum]